MKRIEEYRQDIVAAVEQSAALTPVVAADDGTYRRFIPATPNSTSNKCGEYDPLMGFACLADRDGSVYAPTDPLVSDALDLIEQSIPNGITKQVGYEAHPRIYLLKDEVPLFLRSLYKEYAILIRPWELEADIPKNRKGPETPVGPAAYEFFEHPGRWAVDKTLLRNEQGRDPSKLVRFFSDHPASADREARIRDQAASLQLARSQDVGGFDRLRADLRRRAPASTAVAQRWEEPQTQGAWPQDSGQYDVRVDQPSSRFQRFEQRNGFYTIEHPDNWRAYGSASGYAVSMAPEGGVVNTRNGQQAMLYGVIINHYAPFESSTARQQGNAQRSYAPFEDTSQWSGDLEAATDDLVRQIIRTNSSLRAQDGQARREEADGRVR